jgi:hypothetical protein
MKTRVIAGGLGLCSLTSYAYISGIAIQTDKHVTMQVSVNGKVYNKQPESFVRIKSQPGLFHLQLKVLNPENKVWYVIRRDVKVEKGLEFYYKVTFGEDMRPVFKLIKQYPVYSKYFLNPAMYNKHPVS